MVVSMLITRMNIAGLTDLATERRACAFLNEERKAHALSYHKEKNRAQSIGAWLLFAYSLRQWMQGKKAGQVMYMTFAITELTVGKVLEELQNLNAAERDELFEAAMVGIGEHGKPYLQNSCGLFFNLSHSGEYVLCGIADRQIGVDIQKRHDKDVSGVKEKIHNAQDKEEDFFLLFSAKEAFCKCTGEGLQRDLSHIAVDAAKNIVMDTTTGEIRRLFTDFMTESEIQGYVETVVVV